ncbi:MAG: DUF1207 domain-containing protein [Planctomycetia bacterium]|nr:DUF1207 domain-containing protein [Planctomycetia bacterium]
MSNYSKFKKNIFSCRNWILLSTLFWNPGETVLGEDSWLPETENVSDVERVSEIEFPYFPKRDVTEYFVLKTTELPANSAYSATNFSVYPSEHAQAPVCCVPCQTICPTCPDYPWAPSETLCVRGQAEPILEEPTLENTQTTEEIPEFMNFSESDVYGTLGTYDHSEFSSVSDVSGVSGTAMSVGPRVLYTPEEEAYHYWDPSFRACIPGKGRPLPTSNEAWTWQVLPGGTLFRAYFASNREGRMGIHFINEDTTGLAYWDPTLGGRINLIRYGTTSRLYPEGVQLDIECGAIARLTLKGDRDLHGTDYRFGVPITFRKNGWEFKIGYYHISSHMGDEWIVKNYAATGEVYRINYVRDCLMWGIGYRPDANWRFYVGGDYVFYCDGGAKPWQFEAGAEYSPMMLPNHRGSPFLAVHFRWSEDTDFDTYSALEAGWQWKTVYQHTMRTGLYAMAGHADQYQFYNRWEKQIGLGFWYDF